jgi:hypothetical protein
MISQKKEGAPPSGEKIALWIWLMSCIVAQRNVRIRTIKPSNKPEKTETSPVSKSKGDVVMNAVIKPQPFKPTTFTAGEDVSEAVQAEVKAVATTVQLKAEADEMAALARLTQELYDIHEDNREKTRNALTLDRQLGDLVKENSVLSSKVRRGRDEARQLKSEIDISERKRDEEEDSDEEESNFAGASDDPL